MILDLENDMIGTFANEQVLLIGENYEEAAKSYSPHLMKSTIRKRNEQIVVIKNN